jgi:hypothetical protein
MAIYKKWSGSTADEVVIPKTSKKVAGRNVGAIRNAVITNGHAANATRVRLYLDDGNHEFNILVTVVPAHASLKLSDLGYDGSVYDLKITLSGGGYDISLIIK